MSPPIPKSTAAHFWTKFSKVAPLDTCDVADGLIINVYKIQRKDLVVHRHPEDTHLEEVRQVRITKENMHIWRADILTNRITLQNVLISHQLLRCPALMPQIFHAGL